ncbi:hypothetical protein M9H77_16266 [Catharanthus roseus]|uniref:Uncharacterized protein n=1 Tax=Catharanthus roseus TaxID=4058 RepID=A0ACC0B1A6_CATRO|nr:hypothetical protein M9H77_16266 [Catharanthus roseus]
MTAIDDAFDSDFEEPRSIALAKAKKKRKVIGLDDLLADYYEEKSKLLERESKKKAKKPCASDEEKDEDVREVAFAEFVDECQEKMGQMSGDDEVYRWGLDVFGNQKTMPLVGFPDVGSCKLLQSFKGHETSSLVQVEIEKEETFLQGLLTHGWLLKLVYVSGKLEESIATWTFNLMLYSSREDLRTSACNFWCAVLQADQSRMVINWLPTYSEFKRALEIYGFQLDMHTNMPSDVEMDHTDSNSPGPPQNIRHWMKFVAVSCAQRRDTQLIFSIPEMEDLIVVIISLFLDRRLLGLSMMLHECVLATINSFIDDHWHESCSKLAKSLAFRLPTDVNSLRILESISGVDARSKNLRSAVAFQFLVSCFDEKVVDAEDMLRLLMAINVKDKDCDLFKMYRNLNLAENWLSFDPKLKDKAVIREMWGVCLRNCSCLISSTDMRPFASKVRSKASYLLQGTCTKYSNTS